MKSLERPSLYVLLVAGVAIALAAGFLWLHLAMPFDGTRLSRAPMFGGLTASS